MSFSGQVKKELSHIPPFCKNCRKLQLTAMLLFSHADKNSLLLLSTDHRFVAESLYNMIKGILPDPQNEFSIEEISSGLAKTYVVSAASHSELKRLYQALEFSGDLESFDTDTLNLSESRACCLQAFIRGAFMVCGSITDPQKEYHLEFSVLEPRLAKALAEFLLLQNIALKTTARKGNTILYLKESEPIEDVLTYMGAVNSSLELMNIKIYKDVRNKVNRVTNCETANIEKTVNAAGMQVDQIRYIAEKIGLEQLPEELREIAYLRMENPEMSLRELCGELSEPLSRSGINHRLKRISQIAEDLREKELR